MNSTITLKCKKCGEDFTVKLKSKNPNLNSITLCTECQKIRNKERANSKAETKHKRKIIITCKRCGEDFSIVGNRNPERTNLATIPYCTKCQGMISEEKKKQLEDKQLNKKLKILSRKSSFYNPHKLNSISMPEPELKKHLRNGDTYNT